MPLPTESQSSEKGTILVLFDVDGTITRKDSLFDFIIFYRGKLSFYLGMLWLSPILVLFKLGLIPNWKAKERVLTLFFGKEPLDVFQQRCDAYAQQRLPLIVKESALRQIREFQQLKADIYLVSASAENWLASWSNSLGIHLIATRLEVLGGKITGKIAGNNCYGTEKAARIQKEINLSLYNKIYAYGDSRGDEEMLALADFPHFREFK